MTGSCGSCRFSMLWTPEILRCHRYPPVPVYGDAHPRWPMVQWAEVCGEWAAPVPDTQPVPADHREER